MSKVDTLNELKTELPSFFNRGFGDAEVYYKQMVTNIPVTTGSKKIVLVNNLGNIREWLGGRVANILEESSYEVSVAHYEETLSVGMDDIDDGNIDLYKIMTEQMGEDAAKHPDTLFATLIESGTTTECIDGQYFFDTDHPYAGGVNDNDLAAKPLNATNLKLARNQMAKFKKPNGTQAALIADTLVVPTDLGDKAEELLFSNYYPDEGATTTKLAVNTLKGKLNLVVNPYLTNAGDTSTWYVMRLKDTVKPFAFLDRTPMKFVPPKDDPTTSDRFFDTNEVRYGINGRYAVGFFDPYRAIRIAGS